MCCTSDTECAQLGLPPGSSNEYGCAEGHVCRDFYCVSADAPDAISDPRPDAQRCGDGVLTTEEQCDDGNTASGDGCSATCDLEHQCGNGIVEPGETCDDGNLACGTCSADCQVYALKRAIGTIEVVAGNSLREGDAFTLDDGIHPAQTFKFMRNAIGTPPQIIRFDLFESAAEVRGHVAEAINDSGLWFFASFSGPAAVSVIHNQFTSVGNIAMNEAVADPLFRVTGMSGGAGGNCGSGQSCRSNNDCFSNTCSLNTCQ